MIKEASRDTDLGATLKGSMNMQGIVSTFLFSTIMGRLQVGLDLDITNNATQLSTLELDELDESVVGRLNLFVQMPDAYNWTNQLEGRDAAEHVLMQWCAIYACDL